MKINILSIAHKYPGQGVYSATEDHMYLLESIVITIYIKIRCLENMISYIYIRLIQKAFSHYCSIKKESFCVISAHIVPNSLKGSLKLNRFWLFLFRIYLWSFTKLVMLFSCK